MLSVIVIAKNEAANIARCLSSVSWADEIIVLDSGSSDNTMAIAKTFTDKVYATNWEGYGIQKQRALEHATGDWVLNLDADESVSERLKTQIQKAIVSNTLDAFRLPIRLCFYGKPLRYSSSPSRHIRLFKREGARYSNDIVHEKVLLPQHARIGRLSGLLLHNSWQDMTHAITKMNRYSSYSAKTRITAQKKASLFKALQSSFWMFFRTYVLQRGFLDGRAGFIISCYNAHASFYRGVKSMYPDKTLDDIPTVLTDP